MKTVLLSCLLIIATCDSFSQYNPRPSRSRFYQSKFSTFTVKPGDILLYTVNKDSQQYNIIVTLKDFGSEIKFDYILPDQSFTGNIAIPAGVVSYALKYDTLLDSSKKDLKEKSILWLSKKNYSDLHLVKETTMDLGNGAETFVRKNTGSFLINYKGKEKIITAYNVENTNEKAKKHFIVLNDEQNPLMIKMNVGWTMTLKEVR